MDYVAIPSYWFSNYVIRFNHTNIIPFGLSNVCIYHTAIPASVKRYVKVHFDRKMDFNVSRSSLDDYTFYNVVAVKVMSSNYSAELIHLIYVHIHSVLRITFVI